jgi:putative transposase
MAISNFSEENKLQLIHHSDRGSQYCSSEYVKLLETNNIGIMTEMEIV